MSNFTATASPLDPVPTTFGTIHIATAVISTLLVFLYTLYQYLLPKPIPGIPYNKEATKSLLGDIPRLQKQAPDNPFGWMIAEARRHDSPLSQFFIEPFQKPAVLITDFREGQDILMRRKEFERSDFTINLLSGEAPNFHINIKTGPEWKAHRRLLQDLMSPGFLHNVAAPNIYKSAANLLDVWKMKAKAAAGKPFGAERDIFYTALDAVFDFGFGSSVEHRALIPQIEMLQADNEKKPPVDESNPTAVEFPGAPIHPTLETAIQTADNIMGVAATGFLKIAWWFIGIKPSVRSMRALRTGFLKDQVHKAVERHRGEGQDGSDSYVKSAVDLIIQRETTFAKKENREPVYWSDAMRDELLGFIVAGHDTTSTTLCWGVKFLSDNPACQQRLREALLATHADAVADDRLPSHEEITGANIPYLEAVVEEMLRLAHTTLNQDRQCKEDTIVLGHRIPKGTTVFIPNKGPSFTESGFDIDEKLRSPSSRTAAVERGVREWSNEGMGDFYPERWLSKNDDGEEVYDALAGPTMPFGLGLRGCFGRKLAYMELRLIVTLLVWTFDFRSCGEELSNYEDIETLTRKPKQCFVNLEVV
ncbi:cytochrome P450 [Colletotrichum orchidophilum]|uniref:Cytochrome P450 n=1 Tax=Colletotrichum orchidophilum TaxID=1209926 RepID=A0A1G4B5X3_9PEZI|nr:cytochrome P450 [Colletotrichum orchidophilum]OHE96840.1 cytochrome P450 [Colletotrichum orchidophilum]